jgi:hypothetical protein
MASECLECLIGATRVEVPLADVERLLEYQAAPPPPLAEPWVGGIGLQADNEDLFLSVSLPGGSAPGFRELVHGLLFRIGDGGHRWALEIDRVVGLRAIDGSGEPHRVPEWACPPAWLLHGRDSAGHSVRLLDVRAAERTLSGPGAPEARP